MQQHAAAVKALYFTNIHSDALHASSHSELGIRPAVQ